ncbi:inositol oxygenase-like [Patiria miniata]|uniref:Inositol oxygenase n=1 Tax=Patiria miniata TaxID=46514 RepID=A0A913ZWV4_PATMI|nr:inositol oxygenase-like [Patiria miniata]
MEHGTVTILDPSEIYRPDVNEKQFEGTDFKPSAKEIEKFRQFVEHPPEDDPQLAMIKNTYKLMHTHQTVEYVRKKHEQWCKFDRGEFTIMKALEFINTIVDESDPDTSVPNIYHAFQTAERIRERHPDKEWMILTGLIHDLGKVMAAWGEPQWSVVGDTFVVGCAVADSIVYRKTSFVDNPDLNNPAYNSKCGIYEEHCGLANVMMSWGHDEYFYRVLIENDCKLPEEGLYMIRYHSFYPWHTGGDYMHLCNNKDMEMLKWVREFNQFDLYSKSDGLPDLDALRPYYQALIDKYIPGTLKW